MKLFDENTCTGCMACINVCPVEAISINTDNYGFYIPQVNDKKCVNCGACDKVCPVRNHIVGNKTPKVVYAAISKNPAIRISSSSGGVFGVLAESVIKNGGIVVGAMFDKRLRVVHKTATSYDELKQIMGSKYVQSEIGFCFRDIKQKLEQGTTVLFSGTPCQIVGLKEFLNHDYDELITVDFICHGVPTPLAWHEYIKYRQSKENSHISKVVFRDKTEGWKKYSLKMNFENGKEYREIVGVDPFLHAFVFNIMLRESCYQCKVKEYGYLSDITLCDFWGADNQGIGIANLNKGVSGVLINTEEGDRLFRSVEKNIEKEVVAIEQIDAGNPSRLLNAQRNPYREVFLKTLIRKGFMPAYNRWIGDHLYSKASRKMIDLLKRNNENTT